MAKVGDPPGHFVESVVCERGRFLSSNGKSYLDAWRQLTYSHARGETSGDMPFRHERVGITDKWEGKADIRCVQYSLKSQDPFEENMFSCSVGVVCRSCSRVRSSPFASLCNVKKFG